MIIDTWALVHISVSLHEMARRTSRRYFIPAVDTAAPLSALYSKFEALTVPLAASRLFATAPGFRFLRGRVEEAIPATNGTTPDFIHLLVVRFCVAAAGAGAAFTAKLTTGEAHAIELEASNFGAFAALLASGCFVG